MLSVKRTAQNIKRSLHRAVHPHPALLAAAVCLSAVALALVFIRDLRQTPPAYAAYLFSSWTLIALIATAPDCARRIRARLDEIPLFHRWRTELDFRAWLSLHLVLFVNLLFSAWKGALGLILHSPWLGGVAVYYLILGSARFLLFRHLRSGEENPVLAYKRYRFCGFLLLVLTLSVQLMAFHAIYFGSHPVYPGIVIYATAAYTFFTLCLAIVNYIRYHRRGNPIYEAHRSFSLATALVSLYTLQTALIATFGESKPGFQRIMDSLTGGVVLILIVLLSVHMIRRANRALRALKG